MMDEVNTGMRAITGMRGEYALDEAFLRRGEIFKRGDVGGGRGACRGGCD